MADEVALYRKYRPQSPSDVLGQDHVVRALVGAVNEGRLSHAFLFCGPRGTGKTSTARILAKMVNCEQGPTAEPDGTCEQCVRIRDGTHLDVVEIDAASHGGVEDARELRERAPTAPAMGREKVYILDEAQRLSREAFDALLKLLEEPPPGVRFVLATTEPHKMPATIVSRCQRFDFRRASTETAADLVEHVAKDEGITLARPVAELMARHAEGSFREALKLLDQSAVLGGTEVTEETVTALLGAPQGDVQFELADAVALSDTKEVFVVVQRVVEEGTDLRHFTGQALGHFRDLLLVRAAPEDPAVLDVDAELRARLVAQGAKFTPGELSRILSLLVAAQTDMRWTTSPRLTLELALVRAALPEADPSSAGLGARIERLERLAGVEPSADLERPTSSAPQASPRPTPAPRTRRPRPEQPSASTAETPAEAPAGEPPATIPEPVAETQPEPPAPHAPDTSSIDIGVIRRSWPQLLERLQQVRKVVLRAHLESVTAAAFDGDTLELAFPPGRKFAVEKVQSKEEEFRDVFAEVFGVRPRVRCVARDVAPGATVVDEEPPATKEDAVARIKAELDAAEVEELHS
jgi:DNA polymerase III subunit gamma/tau